MESEDKQYKPSDNVESTPLPEHKSGKTHEKIEIKHTGAKLREFQIADEKDTPTDLYARALNILKQNQATIANRYHREGYLYSYWEYQNKIWRQKLKKVGFNHG